MSGPVPHEIKADLARARRLEWLTLGWMGSVVLVMFFAMGSSQAMRTAWIEDLLSLIPAIVFLVAAKIEWREPTHAFPFGFHRVQSLGFFISAVALASVGASLLFESVMTLIKQEHVTIAPMNIFGRDIWAGWVMIAVLAYSVLPPVILGRMKQPVAERLQDKVLHTDAMMQKADWMTGLAGIGGVLGVGLGFWGADATAAGLISLSIIRDAFTALESAAAELIDGAPRKLEKDEVAKEAEALEQSLRERWPGCEIRLRETGRFINAQIGGVEPPSSVRLADYWPGRPDRAWRLAQMSFVPPEPDEHS